MDPLPGKVGGSKEPSFVGWTSSPLYLHLETCTGMLLKGKGGNVSKSDNLRAEKKKKKILKDVDRRKRGGNVYNKLFRQYHLFKNKKRRQRKPPPCPGFYKGKQSRSSSAMDFVVVV